MISSQSESLKNLFDYIVSNINVYDEGEKKSIAFLILEHLFQARRQDVLMNKAVEKAEPAVIDAIIGRINTYEPIQYILGFTEFYGRKFYVAPGVLIPRPETEELCDLIIKDHKGRAGLSILDIGTGSGCIAITLQKELNAVVTAMDVSEEAISIASRNAKTNEATVNFTHASILNAPDPSRKYDIIVSNPPYIRESERVLMSDNVLQYEPSLALFVKDTDPLLFYRSIRNFALLTLPKGGRLYFEINEALGMETVSLLLEKGFINIRIIKDLSNKDRIISAEYAQ